MTYVSEEDAIRDLLAGRGADFVVLKVAEHEYQIAVKAGVPFDERYEPILHVIWGCGVSQALAEYVIRALKHEAERVRAEKKLIDDTAKGGAA